MEKETACGTFRELIAVKPSRKNNKPKQKKQEQIAQPVAGLVQAICARFLQRKNHESCAAEKHSREWRTGDGWRSRTDTGLKTKTDPREFCCACSSVQPAPLSAAFLCWKWIVCWARSGVSWAWSGNNLVIFWFNFQSPTKFLSCSDFGLRASPTFSIFELQNNSLTIKSLRQKLCLGVLSKRRSSSLVALLKISGLWKLHGSWGSSCSAQLIPDGNLMQNQYYDTFLFSRFNVYFHNCDAVSSSVSAWCLAQKWGISSARGGTQLE